jgi:transcription antitermination factor NusG
LARNSRTARARAHRAFTASHRSYSVTRNRAPDDLDLTRPWYLVFTTPRGEARAAKALEKAGCKIFLPTEHRVYVTNRRKTEYDIAIYPRYLLASGLPNLARRLTLVGPDGRQGITIDGRPITDIRQFDGVSDVIRGGDGAWAKVPLIAMERFVEYQNTTPPPPTEPAFRSGQEVQIIDGPFADFLATVTEVLNKHEAHVLVEIFGRPTPIRIELANIENT